MEKIYLIRSSWTSDWRINFINLVTHLKLWLRLLHQAQKIELVKLGWLDQVYLIWVNESWLTEILFAPFYRSNCHTRLHLGFSAKLRIWQVSACKMEPRSGNISWKNHPPTHPPTIWIFLVEYTLPWVWSILAMYGGCQRVV